MPTEEAYSSGHLVLSHFRTCKCLILRPISPELVFSPDFWVSNIPQYFCFYLKTSAKSQSMKVCKTVHPKGSYLFQTWPQEMTLDLKKESHMSKYMEQTCRQLCISNILISTRGIAPAKIDETQTWYEAHKKKVIYKISPYYVKAYRRKVWKNCYSISCILGSKRGSAATKIHNTRTWSEVLIESHLQNFRSICQSM